MEGGRESSGRAVGAVMADDVVANPHATFLLQVPFTRRPWDGAAETGPG
jgi:hypothetical protein